MKKYIAIILLASLLLTSCSSSGGAEEETLPETEAETAEDTMEPETDEETVRKEVEVFEYHTLTLEKDPVMENGTLILYFADDTVWFENDTEFRIGIRSEDEAYTIAATSETAFYPDMLIEDDTYCGIALRPSEEIPAGSYRMSVTFEHFICDFEYTVQ